MTSLMTIGDNVVDRYPQLGVMYPGGNAVNVAVNARRLGAEVTYVGVVGDDEAGRLVVDSLRHENVDLRWLGVKSGPNAFATVSIVDGNRVFAGGDVGVSRFRLNDEHLAAAATYDCVHTGECSMVEADLPRIAASAARLSFDFSERPSDYVRTYAPLVDIAVLSNPRASVETAAQLARDVAALGPSTVAVTLGDQGAVVLSHGQMAIEPAGAGPVVDTLGAGDAFIARLLIGLVEGEPLPALVAAATTYATHTCSTNGAFGHASPIDHTGFPKPRGTSLIAGRIFETGVNE
jgi:fructoselysine 6-kinase